MTSKSKNQNRKKAKAEEARPHLNVAVVQMTSADNVSRNVQAINDVLDELLMYAYGERHVDMVVFPENCLFLRTNTRGQEIRTFNLREPFWGEFQDRADKMGCHIFFGSVQVSGLGSIFGLRTGRKVGKKKPSNSMVLVSPGTKKPKLVYSKIHLFDVDVDGAPPARESDSFQHGKSAAILKVGGWKIGLSICYDLRFSELYHSYAKKGVDLILVPAAFLVPTGQAHWHVLLRARAIESQAYVLAPAQSGGHLGTDGSERHTYGHSLIVGPWGQIIDEAQEQGPRTLISSLSLDEIKKVRKQIPMAGHRRLK